MKISTIEKLCCPFDKQNLQLQIFAQQLENVIEGLLSCTTCQRKYPIIFGVPIMAPDEYRQLKLEQPVVDRWKQDYHIDPVKLLP